MTSPSRARFGILVVCWSLALGCAGTASRGREPQDPDAGDAQRLPSNAPPVRDARASEAGDSEGAGGSGGGSSMGSTADAAPYATDAVKYAVDAADLADPVGPFDATAASDLGARDGGSGAASRCSGASHIVCDGFESGIVDRALWKVASLPDPQTNGSNP